MSRSLKTLSLVSLVAFTLMGQVAKAQDVYDVHFKNHTNEVANICYYYGSQKHCVGQIDPGQTVTHKTWLNIYWSISHSNMGTGRAVTKADDVLELGTPAAKPVTPIKRPNGPVRLRTVFALNNKVLDYAKANTGRLIGNGQCTELAYYALQSAGARLPQQGYDWGRKLAGPKDLQPGDILQMWNADFGWGASSRHTVVVTTVRGTKLTVLEQNIDGSAVQAGEYDLDNLRRGTIECFRPVAGNQRVDDRQDDDRQVNNRDEDDRHSGNQRRQDRKERRLRIKGRRGNEITLGEDGIGFKGDKIEFQFDF